MAYTDTDQLFTLLPAFRDEEGENIEVAAMQISQADADSIIDSALDKRYSVPFGNYIAAPVDPEVNECPRIITTIASMLSRSIFLSGEYMSNVANSQPRVSMVLWDRAWMLLNKIIAKEMQVVGSTVTPVYETNAGVYARKSKYISPLAGFDLESPLYPRLHDRMRDKNQLKIIADDGTITYYVGSCSG